MTAVRTLVRNRTRLRVHLLALLVLVVATAPFLHLTGSYSSDEGAYAVQVHRLTAGHWDVQWSGSEVDPSQRWFPFENASQSGPRRFAYVQHPAWPLAMAAAVRVFGATVGMRILPVAGTLGIAAAAWFLAAEIDSRRRAVAFWLAAAGPALAGATMLWAHTASAALAGFAAVAALRVIRRPRAGTTAVLAVLIAAGVLVRAEGVLWAGALGLGCGAWALWQRRPRVAAVVTGAVWGSALVARAAEQVVIQVVARGAYADPGLRHQAGSFLSGRFTGTLREVIAAGSSGPGAVLFGLAALALAVIGGKRLARAGHERTAALLLGAAAVCFAGRTLIGGGDPATGLLGCWPVAAAGLAALGARRHRLDVLVAAVTVLFGAAVVITQYDGGGGVEWGGRFFSPAIVPLAALAAGGLLTAVTNRRVLAAVVALAAIPALSGLRSVALVRRSPASIAARVRASGATVAVTSFVALPRMEWATDPHVTWFLAPEDEVGAVLARLRSCVPRVALVVEDPRPASAEGYTVVSGAAGARGYRLLIAENREISRAPSGTPAGRLGACPTGL